MARLARGLLAWLLLLSLLLTFWSQCCWIGERVARRTASAIGAVLLEVFVRLDRQVPVEVRGRSRRCEDVSLRVTKGLGSRGYEAVRVSAVCRLPGHSSEAEERCAPEGVVQMQGLAEPEGRGSRVVALDSFEHCGRFQQRWSKFHLSSSVLSVEPGEEHRLFFNHSAGPLAVDISIPKRGSGVHGVVIGDPCISSRYLPGLCNSQWDVLKRLTELLDLVTAVDRLDFLVILGDAFYDVHGGLTAEFWRHLSRRTQQVMLLAVPGNHDFWMFAPQAALPQDQLGFGFAQWFAQDTAAARGARPFLTQGPNLAAREREELPSAENFFFYHALGNVGFLGYSAAHPWEAQDHLFREACEYFSRDPPDQVYLLGHWNKVELGCQAGMDVQGLFATLREGACAALADRMYYFMGHDHCNQRTEDGRGFMVGGVGAAHGNCNEWGFGYVDTRAAGSQRGGGAEWASKVHMITKFTVATDFEDYYPALRACILGRRSLRACAGDHGEMWMNSTSSPW